MNYERKYMSRQIQSANTGNPSSGASAEAFPRGREGLMGGVTLPRRATETSALQLNTLHWNFETIQCVVYNNRDVTKFSSLVLEP